MTKSFFRLALLVSSFAFARYAWAAVSSPYPGLSDMIGSSQAIVVVSIQSAPKTPVTNSSNVWAVQRVKVLSVLMGDFREQDEMDVALSPFLLFPTSTYLELAEFPLYERYVLFIRKDWLSPLRPYAIVNAEGSAFWIPRQTDLSVVDPRDVRSSVEALLNVITIYLDSRERELDESVQRFLSDAPRR